MLGRIGTSMLFSSLVTAGHVLIMSALIATGRSALSEDNSISIVDFIRVKKENEVNIKKKEINKPTKRKTPPPDLPKANVDPIRTNANVDVEFVLDAPKIDISKFGSGDGEYLPIVKVAPIYPRRALSRGIEGYVLVEFTVTKLGTVVNPVVVEADPPKVFDKAAMKAALKFKYKPKIINGKPIDVAGVQNKIIFKIAD